LIPLFLHIFSRRSATLIYSAVTPSLSWLLADQQTARPSFAFLSAQIAGS